MDGLVLYLGLYIPRMSHFKLAFWIFLSLSQLIVRARLAKMEGGATFQFCDYFTPVEMVISEIWNRRETVICMGKRNGTVV